MFDLRSLAFACTALIPETASFGDLVGPAAVTHYGGPRERASYGYVSSWPVGFFVAGSSIMGINGLYDSREPDHGLPHGCAKTYQNMDTGWVLAYVNAENEGYVAAGGKATEWLLVDGNGEDRFGTVGESVIPGAGTAWRHLHRKISRFHVGERIETRGTLPDVWDDRDTAVVVDIGGKSDNPITVRLDKNGKSISTQAWRLRRTDAPETATAGSLMSLDSIPQDDENELPWQIIAIMAEAQMEDLRNKKREYDEGVKQALLGLGESLPALPTGQDLPLGPFVPLAPNVDGACKEGRKDEALSVLTRAFGEAKTLAERALLHKEMAECYRRLLEPSSALDEANLALALFPKFKQALFQRALALLDANRISEAIIAFEVLLQADRDWPDLDKWLLRAHSRARRQGRAPVVDDFSVGDRVRTRQAYEGLWSADAVAEVIGLGPSNAPLLIRLESNGHTISTQSELVKHAAEAAADVPSVRGFPETDHYVTLSLAADFSAEELRRAYRSASLKQHPDKGGSQEAFQRVGAAHATLSDAARRRAYDAGDDLPKGHDGASLREEIDRRYFPERQGWQVFGDPFKERRKAEERQRREDELRDMFKRDRKEL